MNRAFAENTRKEHDSSGQKMSENASAVRGSGVIAAATPPMGWNAWNAFRTDVDEIRIMQMATLLVELGLSDLGYAYVNIDDGWAMRRNADGRLEVRTTTFPSALLPDGKTSFRPWVERLHSMGLKAGIYTDVGRNTCAQIWDPDRPNQPEGSLTEREVGAYGFEEQDMKLFFSEWGFDFIKLDACGVADYARTSRKVAEGLFRGFPQLVVRGHPEGSDCGQVASIYCNLANAAFEASATKNPIISICAWGEADVSDWGSSCGHLWRTSGDIGNTWDRVMSNFDTAAPRELFAGPGRWNDPDIMEIGNGEFDPNHLIEAQTHFSLWCIIAAPLFLSLDLSKTSKEILGIVSNAEAIAVNQDPAGNQGVTFRKNATEQIIVKQLSDGSRAITLTNRGTVPATVRFSLSEINMIQSDKLTGRDLWRHSDIEIKDGQVSARLQARETMMLRVSGEAAKPHVRRLYEMPARVRVRQVGYRPSHRNTIRPWVAARLGHLPSGEPVIARGIHDHTALAVAESAHIEVKLDREFRRFQAIPDQAVAIQIIGDGKMIYRGDIEYARPIDIVVEGVSRLEIVMPKAADEHSEKHIIVLFQVALIV